MSLREMAKMFSKELGKPVKIVFQRADDSRFDCCRSASVAQFDASFDADGNLTGIEHALARRGRQQPGGQLRRFVLDTDQSVLKTRQCQHVHRCRQAKAHVAQLAGLRVDTRCLEPGLVILPGQLALIDAQAHGWVGVVGVDHGGKLIGPGTSQRIV